MRFFRKSNTNEPVATRANLGEANTMYYDKEKKRWRQRGKEDEEEEETLAPPPPMAKKTEEPKKESTDEPPAPPAKTGSDLLTAPPNLYSHLRRPAAKAAQSPAVIPAFGVSPAFGNTAAQAVNPNAPRGFGGTAAQPVNPNAPRGFDGKGDKPSRPAPVRKPPANIPARGSPFGAPSAPAQTDMDPEGGGSIPEVAAVSPPSQPPQQPASPPPEPAVAPHIDSKEQGGEIINDAGVLAPMNQEEPSDPEGAANTSDVPPHQQVVGASSEQTLAVDGDNVGENILTPPIGGMSAVGLSQPPPMNPSTPANDLATPPVALRTRNSPFAPPTPTPPEKPEDVVEGGVDAETAADGTANVEGEASTLNANVTEDADVEETSVVTDNVVGSSSMPESLEQAGEEVSVAEDIDKKVDEWEGVFDAEEHVGDAEGLDSPGNLAESALKEDAAMVVEEHATKPDEPAVELHESAESNESAQDAEVEGMVGKDEDKDDNDIVVTTTGVVNNAYVLETAEEEKSRDEQKEGAEQSTDSQLQASDQVANEPNTRDEPAASDGGWGEDFDLDDFDDEKDAANGKPTPAEVDPTVSIEESISKESANVDTTEKPAEPDEGAAAVEAPKEISNGDSINSWVMLSDEQRGTSGDAPAVDSPESGKTPESAQLVDDSSTAAVENEAVNEDVEMDATKVEPTVAVEESPEDVPLDEAAAPEDEGSAVLQEAPTEAETSVFTDVVDEAAPTVASVDACEPINDELKESEPAQAATSSPPLDDFADMSKSDQANQPQFESSEAPTTSQQVENERLRAREAQLEQMVNEAQRLASAREQEIHSMQLAEAAQQERVEAEIADLKQQAQAASEEAQRKSEEERRLLLSKLEDAEEKRKELEVCANALEQRLGGLEKMGIETNALEEKLAGANDRATKAEKSLGEAEAKVAALEEKLNAMAQPAHGQQFGDEADALDLPDFVWNCGSSEVMAFVQKLVAENTELKQQQQQQPSTVAPNISPTNDSGETSASSTVPFNTEGMTADRALAFASTITENDGHQVKPLLALLEEHKNNIKVCSQVCEALESLTFTDTENRRMILQNGGLEAILGVLEQHENIDDASLRGGIDALWNLTFEDEAVDKMTTAGGIDRITAVMRKHENVTELQGGACAVLLNLAVREPNRWKIVQSGGIDLIAAAMQRHCQNEEVLELGCQALYMLAHHQDLRPLVLAAKGSEAATCATSYNCGRTQKWGRFLQEVLAC